jgi:hypothetical protein
MRGRLGAVRYTGSMGAMIRGWSKRRCRVLPIAVVCLLGVVQACTHRLPKARFIQPCRDASQSPPIRDECAAAAIAENAFLEETHHQITTYVISPITRNDSQWHFVILLSDGYTPPADGGHYFVRVDRETGRAEVDPGR